MIKIEPRTPDKALQREIKVETMASGGKTVRPADFDGNGSVRRFLHKFEQCAEVNEWKDAKTKLSQLSVSLAGKAYDFFMHLPTDQKDTYDALQKALMKEYDSPGLQSDYALQLSSSRRKQGQSTSDYMQELEELAERAYPDWQVEPRDGVVRATFINGLGDDLRMTLMLQAPEKESLADLERRARRIEQVQLSRRQATVGRLEATPSVADQVAELRNQVSEVATSMADLQAGVRRLAVAGRGGDRGDSAARGGGYTGRARYSSQGGHDGRGAYSGVKWSGSRGGGGRETGSQCYRCGDVGHMARECRSGPVGGGERSPVQCYRCGQVGHIARGCRANLNF